MSEVKAAPSEQVPPPPSSVGDSVPTGSGSTPVDAPPQAMLATKTSGTAQTTGTEVTPSSAPADAHAHAHALAAEAPPATASSSPSKPKVPLTAPATQKRPPKSQSQSQQLQQHQQYQQQHQQYHHHHQPPPQPQPQPKPLSYRPLTVPEKLNWVDEILVGQLNALPQPLPTDSPQERTNKLYQVIHTLVPEHRPFYNMYQFHQYVGRGLWPWGYHVRLDRADQFLHCTPATSPPPVAGISPTTTTTTTTTTTEKEGNNDNGTPATADPNTTTTITTTAASADQLKPFSVLFRFQPYSHTLPKERRHVYVVHVYHDELTRDHNSLTGSSSNNNNNNNNNNSYYFHQNLLLHQHGASSLPSAANKQPSKSKSTESPAAKDATAAVTAAPKDDSATTKTNTNTSTKPKYYAKVPLSTTQREWNRMYEKLKVYKEKTGHTKVPARYSEDRSLGRWVVEQRFNYNNQRLAQDRIDRLNELEFTWKLRWVATAKQRDISPWQDKFDRLKAYKKVHGTCQVPMNYPEDQALANWIATQRHKYRTNRLTKEEIDLLDSIEFIWRMRADVEDNGPSSDLKKNKDSNIYALRNKLGENENDADANGGGNNDKGEEASKANENESESDRKATRPKADMGHKHGNNDDKSTENKATDKISGAAKKDENGDVVGSWDDQFQTLVAFYKKKGHTDVPKVNQPLYDWVTQQRHNEDNLSEEQVAKLDGVGFTWETPDGTGSRKTKGAAAKLSMEDMEKDEDSIQESESRGGIKDDSTGERKKDTDTVSKEETKDDAKGKSKENEEEDETRKRPSAGEEEKEPERKGDNKRRKSEMSV